MRRCVQPGPPRVAAAEVVPCAATPVRVALPEGAGLLDALGAWMQAEGCDGAMLTLRDVPVAGLCYVLPAPSASPDFAAYYSEDHRLEGPGFIRAGQLTLGWRDGAPFAHCHGLFEDAAGRLSCGHLRVESCVLGRGAAASGHALQGAAFEAVPCRETGFVLLTPTFRREVAANAVVAKLSPNVDVGAALVDIARQAGLREARVCGLGSLVGAEFADGQRLDRFETEFFFGASRLTEAGARLEVTIVEAGGRRVSGVLAPGQNAVLMTVEALVLAGPTVPG